MKAHYLLSTLLLAFFIYATRIDISLIKIYSENICTEYNDSGIPENDMGEKGEEESVEDDLKEFSSFQNNFALNCFRSRLDIIATRQKLAKLHILVEAPPPKIWSCFNLPSWGAYFYRLL